MAADGINRDRNGRALAGLVLGMTTAVAIAAHLVRAGTVSLLKSTAATVPADRTQMVQRWHRANAARLLGAAGAWTALGVHGQPAQREAADNS